MEKIKMALATLAILVAVTGAFAFNVHTVSKSLYLYWVDAATGADDGFRCDTDEAIDRSCNGGTIDCAYGYLDAAHTIIAVTLFKH